ncbi:putative diguanylate cyclase YegE [Aquicella siphonis]|uniref:Putative diguanylate cyclase YegE n=1 Tax=Aquicella siphonis TaxID=254247 RepID=A0A5E4PEP5_9COXI|nr:sensor domain-containing diguanylate cyclase [Aquicella siphonis]VVC74958.1 putative diguanylate cyclase YegE [Aquicella siphonis]
MTKKHHASRSRPVSNKNAPAKPATTTQKFISHMNRLIATQSQLVDANFNLDSFLQEAARQIQLMTAATGAVVELAHGEEMVFRAASGTIEKYTGLREDKNASISGLCLGTHQILRSDDTENDPRVNVELCRKIQARSLVAAPLFHGGNAIGVLKITSDKCNSFDEFDVQTIRLMAGMVGSGLTRQMLHDKAQRLSEEKKRAQEELAKVEKQLKHMSHHDYLTGLPNRNSFNEQLALTLSKSKRKKQLIALMYLNIDHFQNINDTMGHAVGDKLLHAFAMRLKQCIRSSDVAARLGGDEFTLLIDDINETQDAIVIAEKVLQAMRKPFSIQSKPLHITTSIGIAFLKDADISVDEFIKQADQALYVAKNSGRNTYYVFDTELLYERSP